MKHLDRGAHAARRHDEQVRPGLNTKALLNQQLRGWRGNHATGELPTQDGLGYFLSRANHQQLGVHGAELRRLQRGQCVDIIVAADGREAHLLPLELSNGRDLGLGDQREGLSLKMSDDADLQALQSGAQGCTRGTGELYLARLQSRHGGG